MKTLIRSFKYPFYRAYFWGQAISQTGSWVQHIAVTWLIYRLSDSALLLVLVALAGQLPMLLLGPLAGYVSDHFDRKRVLMWTQGLSLLQAVCLAVLAYFDFVPSWVLLSLSLALGVITAIDFPVRQSIVVGLIEDPNDVSNVIALNSLITNIARMVGPMMAGFLLMHGEETICFVVNAASYVVVMAVFITFPESPLQVTTGKHRAGLIQSWRSILGDIWIRRILLLVAALSMFAAPYLTLLPVLAKTAFAGKGDLYGIFMASSGAGALFACIYLARRISTVGLSRIMGVTAMLSGAILVALAFSSSTLLTQALLAGMGFCMLICIASSQTLLQSRINDARRGRVAAAFSMALYGTMPIGGFFLGAITERGGVNVALVVGGVFACLSGALYSQSEQNPRVTTAGPHR